MLGATGAAELFTGTYPGRALGSEDGLPVGRATRNLLVAELISSGELQPAEVEGVRGRRCIVAAEAGLLAQAEEELRRGVPPNGLPAGVALLAPLDPLAWDREFLRSCFDFDYVWEVYVPPAKRRWGYYVLPVLYADRIVGRIEPRIDRKTGDLRILGAWWQDGFDPLADERFAAALAEALEAHRAFAGMNRITWPRIARLRALADRVKRSRGEDRRIPA
jgi:uncharacterized protein YcaQ